VRFTYAARDKNITAIRKTMDSMVASNPEILSLGMRHADGRYLAHTGEHQVQWISPMGKDSTFTHWKVPIYRGTKQWATLEISFTPGDPVVLFGYGLSPLTILLAFFAVVSFIGFIVFMKRSLRYLDPSSVIPSRVQYALDTLTEGVLLLDTKEHIMLANSVFAEKTGHVSSELIGLKASQLNWREPESSDTSEALPWIKAISSGEKQSGILLTIDTKSHGNLTFVVNSAPVIDNNGKSRGAVVTFDDVTELEKQSFQLSRMVELLQMSKNKITQKNKELEILATQDSLTGCLNRRAFFAIAEEHMAKAAAKGMNLACIMADLDLFKSINDNYGHVIGDQVLQYFAGVLQSETREEDAVARYGGEEFCILLPYCNSRAAAVIVERIRLEISSRGMMAIPEVPDIKISSSFGVSDLSSGAQNIEELISQADKALYKAKLSGRNCVVCWDGGKKTDSAPHSGSSVPDKSLQRMGR
jgi:diguanylate cyclase (GGDEF)-like protein/PAS domain S-box-containing protein